MASCRRWLSLGVTSLTAVIVLVAGYLFFAHFSPRFGEEL